MQPISSNCPNIPADLASSLEAEFSAIQEHYLLSEFDDLLVDSGRLCEAVLRYLEWKLNRSFTAIDGRSKPNRNHVVSNARRSSTLEPSLKQQVVNIVETVMDFRNNRNAAHLGSIDPNVIDATTAYQMLSWVIAEIIRIEARLSSATIQLLINGFAERPIPIIYSIAGKPIVLDTNISHQDEVLVLLYDNKSAIDISTLFKWTHHSNITRWKQDVIKKLVKDRLVAIDNNMVHILPTGMKRAESTLKTVGA